MRRYYRAGAPGAGHYTRRMKLRPAGVDDLDLILDQRREMFREMGGEYERRLDAFERASREYFESALGTDPITAWWES